MSDYGGDDDGGDDGYFLISHPCANSINPSLPLIRYEPYEPTFDDDEPVFEPVDPDDPENPDGTARLHDENSEGVFANGGTTPHHGHGQGNVVVVGGDAAAGGGGAAAAGVKKNAVVALKEKRIPDEKRSTTPYMTKYERARVLGTRALQIRLVFYFSSIWFP